MELLCKSNGFFSIFRRLYYVQSPDISKLLKHLHLVMPQAKEKSDYQMSLQIWKIRSYLLHEKKEHESDKWKKEAWEAFAAKLLQFHPSGINLKSIMSGKKVSMTAFKLPDAVKLGGQHTAI